MQAATKSLINKWFEGLNSGDLDALLALFSTTDQLRIRNAANPPLEGRGAPRALLEDFFGRTSSRHFQLIDAAETDDGQVFAAWKGTLILKSGIQIATVTLPSELTVELRGIERFEVDAEGKVVQCDIFHETSSIPLAVQALAARTLP